MVDSSESWDTVITEKKRIAALVKLLQMNTQLQM